MKNLIEINVCVFIIYIYTYVTLCCLFFGYILAIFTLLSYSRKPLKHIKSAATRLKPFSHV
jgi:hypothetical protein